MKELNAINLPLNRSVLIEASAGTGKTYTMANLYLRLILGVGCEPLNVDQILVVTFTKAATQELRDRIRAKLGNVAKWFENPDDETAQEELKDPFLQALFQTVQDDLPKARLRLKIAERDMDLASIFTIDSFCQKMLFQYAFDSGMRFDIDLQPDESELLARLSEETWRELFYREDKALIVEVIKHLNTPKNALKLVKKYLTGEIPTFDNIQNLNSDDLFKKIKAKQALIAEIKAFWQKNQASLSSLILEDLEKPKGSLNRNSYRINTVKNDILNLTIWAKSQKNDVFKDWDNAWQKFTQSFINSKTTKTAQPISSLLFEQADELLEKLNGCVQDGDVSKFLTIQFLNNLREKLRAYKQSHKEKSFNDITDFMHKSLMSESGERFAQSIRSQYRFAMIDEFQDTNLAQYEIFQRIFMQNMENQGFVMIGDPKQSIYKFRNADIFSYLAAAKKVGEDNTYGMDKNWRSAPQIVNDINALFSFKANEKSPFIYDGIQFQSVKSDEKNDLLKGESLTNCYLMPKYKMEQAAEYAAYQIQQQLKQAEQGTLFLQKNGEKQPLASKDIAILVRGKYEAEAVKNALARRNIRAIYLSARDSVFESQEAQELLFILQACLDPYDQRNLLAVLGSGLFGLTSAEIFERKNNEQSWDECVNDFIRYHDVWDKQGVLPMLHEIYLKQEIIKRLNGKENSERRITDLLHLTELLQEAMIELRSETALVKWLQQQIQNPNGDADEQKLRLESEQELIKIITIHGSKGLEYPVVWLPFIANPSKGFQGTNSFATYHNENNELCWAFSPISEQEKAALDREEFAEDLRLLYVALTRAKHQLNFILPENFDKKWNSVSYLLGNGDITDQLDTKTLLNQKSLQCKVIDYPENMEDEWQASTVDTNELQAKTFTGSIRTKGQITSFTALHNQHERLQNLKQNAPFVTVDDALDYDRTLDYFPNEESDDEQMPTPYHFPHSTRVGNVLHKVFENWDFTHSLSDEEILEQVCQPLNLAEEWLDPLKLWFTQIVNTPFGNNLTLAQISKDKRLNEWQFYLRLANEKALPQLNSLLKAGSRLAKNLPDLHLAQLEGFVRGFVDLVVQVDTQFYIIDYKSNYLGKTAQNYSAEKLENTMGKYRYDLQYLLYTLALHRYLRARLGCHYDYEQHFGGVAYLFLRGMNGEPNAGVYFDKPSKTLIEQLDQLFDRAI